MVTDDKEYETESNTEHIFCQGTHDNLNRDWLLADNQSAVDQVTNGKYLINIHTVDHLIMVHCNAGSTATNQNGLLGKFTVWHYQGLQTSYH